MMIPISHKKIFKEIDPTFPNVRGVCTYKLQKGVNVSANNILTPFNLY